MRCQKLRFSLRFFLELTFLLALGLACLLAVYSGEANEWPSFQVRDGYWGTQFLSPTLYMLGDDELALRIVAGIWFCYGTTIGSVVVLVGRYVFRKQHGRN